MQSTQAQLLEQYKLAVQMADRLSSRASISELLLSVCHLSANCCQQCWNSFRMVLDMHYIHYNNIYLFHVVVAVRKLQSYKYRLKFEVIKQIEATLPFAMFADEEDIYKAPKRIHYKPLSLVEQTVPALFAALSIMLLAITLTDWILS